MPLTVKISAVTLAPFSWQYGRKLNAATATPICTSSKSPGTGKPSTASEMSDRVHQRDDHQQRPAEQRPALDRRDGRGHQTSPIPVFPVLQRPIYLEYLSISLRALATSAAPSMPLPLTSAIQRSTTGSSLCGTPPSRRRERDMFVAGLHRDRDAAVIVLAPDLGRLSATSRDRRHPEGLLDVGRQLVPARLVHRHLKVVVPKRLLFGPSMWYSV